MYCVSTLAQAGALAALEDSAHIRKAVENNTEQSERLFPAMAESGIQSLSTWGNFLYCELGQDASNLPNVCKHEGIVVRALGQWGAPQAIRITIGTPEQNDALLRAMQEVEEF